MIRRPRLPLTTRLLRIERELEIGARLAMSLIEDITRYRRVQDDVDSRLTLVAMVATSALAPLGIEPDLLLEFVDAVGPEGNVEEAEELATDIVAAVVLRLAPMEGGGH